MNSTLRSILIALGLALVIGFALSVFLDPSFPDLLEIIDNPKL